MEVLPKLHWIESRAAFLPASNTYLWVTEDGLMMVDTGTSGDAGTILNYIHEIGHHVSEIMAILITHADVDHAGGAAVLQERSGAPVYAGAQSAELLSRGKSPEHMPRPIQFFIDRFLNYRPVPASAIQVIEEGEAMPNLDEWLAVATPGHTLDHHSFCSPVHGILFAGDALNTRGDRLQSSPGRISADEEAARQSAMHLLRLHPAVIACGHGRPMNTHDADDVMVLFRTLQGQAIG